MGRIHGKGVEEQSKRTRNKRKCSEKGKNLPETEDVTHSCSALTSEVTSRQEVDTVIKRNTKSKELKDSLEVYSASLKLKQMCSNYVSSMKESTLKSQEMMSLEENDGPGFEFSKKLVALAQEKQARTTNNDRKRRRSESKTFCRKRKVSVNGGRHDNSGLKKKRQGHSQSSSEDLNTSFGKMVHYESKLTNEEEMKVQRSPKRWSRPAPNLTPMDFEFSRRLKDLSRKNQRYHHEDHVHCCRCVQSFECFWPRSNLQTIRRQGFC